jgi:transposase
VGIRIKKKLPKATAGVADFHSCGIFHRPFSFSFLVLFSFSFCAEFPLWKTGQVALRISHPIGSTIEGDFRARSGTGSLDVCSDDVLRGLDYKDYGHFLPVWFEARKLWRRSLEMSKPNVEIAAFIGLDWADQKHVVTLHEVESNQQQRFILDQTAEALQSWIHLLRNRFAGRAVAIAVEQNRGALIYALMHVDFLYLYPVNPQTLSQFRKAFYPSGAKDDPIDADLLLEILMKHRQHLRVWVPDDVLTRSIQLLTEDRRHLVDERTALTNQLTAALKTYFPQALEWFGDLHTVRACAFLQRWPSLQVLQRATTSSIRKLYKAQGYRGQDKLEQLIANIQQAQPLTQDGAVVLAGSLKVEALVRQIPLLTEAIERYDQQIASLFDQHDDATLFGSFPGAGASLAPRLLGAFGSNRGRFEFAAEMQQLSGIAPVTEKSGTGIWIHWRLACSKFLRQTFHEFAGQSITQCDWARAHYDQLRKRGKSHHAALRALAFKWIRIIFRCWKTRTPYDDTVYCKSLKLRRSPLADELPADEKMALT